MEGKLMNWRIGLVTFMAACFAGAQTQTITCSSDDGGYHTCAIAGGDVRLVRQISGSPCRQGETWGYDANRIWVDRGCRAEFETGYLRNRPSYRR
jgi:hypothetical protein